MKNVTDSPRSGLPDTFDSIAREAGYRLAASSAADIGLLLTGLYIERG